jgi:2-polyprenyl-6-methoxyphenol hydroxylase-like FAD-dependent oxidoreductase
MSMASVRSVVVVGAGIGGLTAAVALRQAGIETTVLERRTEPSRLLSGGGFMLWHNVFHALRQIKLDEPVIAGSSEIHYHEFRSDRGRRLARWSIAPHARRFDAPAVALRRSTLNTILMEAVGDVVMGAQCVGVEQDEHCATAVLSTGERYQADVVIGADGIRSAVRTSLRHGYDVPPRYAQYTAWQAITRLPGEDVVPSGTFFNLWGRGGLRFLYCRLNPGEVYWDAITSDRVSAGFDMVRMDKRAALSGAYRHWPDPVPRIISSTEERAILPVAIHDRPPVPSRSWGYGRVALLGDAAHPQTLNLSQGAGQAIEDGVLLGQLLADTTDPGAVIAHFEDVRRKRVAAMVRMAWRIGRLGHMRSGAACALRDVFMRIFFNTTAERGTYRLMMDMSL